MLKWIITIVLALVVLGLCAPHLRRKLNFGKLPGDVQWRIRGREYSFPFTSTLLLSALLALISRML